MTVAIHQPLYFPWIGYLDKMAKADKFIILDSVAMTKPSPITRNRFLTEDGIEKYLTAGIVSKSHTKLKISEVKLNPVDSINSLAKHENFLRFNYRKAPYFKEVWPSIENLLNYSGESLLEFLLRIINYLREVFDIKTELIFQSTIEYDKTQKSNEMLILLLKSLNADIYLSGTGAKDYMDDKLYEDALIEVRYQKFTSPLYKQFNTTDFIPNLSSIDMLFNCGLKGSRELFWTNVGNSEV